MKNTFSSLLVFLLFVSMFFAMDSCAERHSGKFLQMESDIQSFQQQLADTDDCDELQMLYFGILGLRTDLSMPEEEGGLTDSEFEVISNEISELEVMLNTKTQQLECYKEANSDDLDTSEEEYFDGYNVL